MERKYALLRVIGTISKILGIVAAVTTILGAIGACASGFVGSAVIEPILAQLGFDLGQAGQYIQITLGVVIGIMIVIYGGMAAVSLYAVGQGVHMLITIEENTRLAVVMLQGQSAGRIVG